MAAGPPDAQKKTLVVARNEDPDILDPTLARTYVGRIMVPQLADRAGMPASPAAAQKLGEKFGTAPVT